jgi:hypothetical protein
MEEKMSLSTANKTKLNKMNRAAQDASLGTLLGTLETNMITPAAHIVTVTEANASAVVIDSGLDTISGKIVQIFRSGSIVTSDAFVTATGSALGIYPGAATYTVTGSDVINYLVW